MEIGILRKSGTGALGLVKSKAVGGAFRGQYQNSIVGSIRLICCDLGVPLKCLQGLDHPSLLICFNENVGGKTMGKSGDCRQLQALPKSYSNLNLKKKKKAVWAKQHTSGLYWAHGCNLTSAVELVLCGTVFALGVSFPSLRFWLLARRPVLLRPQGLVLLAHAQGPLWLASLEGLSHQLTLISHLDGRKA